MEEDAGFHKQPFRSDDCGVLFQLHSISKGPIASCNSIRDFYVIAVVAEDISSWCCLRIDPASAAAL